MKLINKTKTILIKNSKKSSEKVKFGEMRRPKAILFFDVLRKKKKKKKKRKRMKLVCWDRLLTTR